MTVSEHKTDYLKGDALIYMNKTLRDEALFYIEYLRPKKDGLSDRLFVTRDGKTFETSNMAKEVQYSSYVSLSVPPPFQNEYHVSNLCS